MQRHGRLHKFNDPVDRAQCLEPLSSWAINRERVGVSLGGRGGGCWWGVRVCKLGQGESGSGSTNVVFLFLTTLCCKNSWRQDKSNFKTQTQFMFFAENNYATKELPGKMYRYYIM